MTRSLSRFWVLALLWHLLSPTNGIAADRVLVVHSYHSDFSWVKKIDQVLEMKFKAANITHQRFYMDTKFNPSEAWKQKSGRNAMKLLRQYEPKVVIAVDDNAQAYFVNHFINQPPFQFVFCGVNAAPETYGYPASNVTGILERTYTAETLQALRTIIPGIRNVAVISDDSVSANLVKPRIEAAAHELEGGMKIVSYQQPGTFKKWKQAISALDRDPAVDALLIPIYHTLRPESQGKSVPAREVMRWTLTHTQKPVVGLLPHAVYNGAFLAVTVNPEEHARVAAEMAIEIAAGKRAVDIPMRTNKEGYVMVNLKNKSHLNVDPTIELDQIADLVIR